MTVDLTGLDEIIEYIDPASCDYQEWTNVGMALKHEGYDVSVWDRWSQRDTRRYHPGECAKKWETFKGGSHSPVTGGTIVAMARDNGWSPCRTSGRALDWNDTVNDDGVIVNADSLEYEALKLPDEWHPAAQLIKYLETLFDSTENVGYVTETWLKDEKYLPTKGCCDRTAGQLIEDLSKCNDDIGSVLGDYNPEAGAWIRFNPLDGNGVKDANITDYRFALVESDNCDIDKQNAIIRELELPVAALVYSGGKSVHAIVRVDAADYTEYRKRVDYLYDVCKKNGLEPDRQNRNPSRLSRMPGVIRNGKKQCLIDTNIGKATWAEWVDWIEGINDDLPEPENLADYWDNLPELSPPLIDGVLRQGHKMLIAGPSKAGKSYALIEMCIAIAEGQRWLGFKCAQGKVLYINLEVDRASCLHRFKDVYSAMRLPPSGFNNIDIWNLRGKAVPMDKLAPKIIRRASKKGYIAIIIDPIYKIITGDENSAEQMSHFCNQFDKVCNELGCAVIYCHHHSKGVQGDKRSMDRASGSGVFARDPDALIDLAELELNDDIRKQQLNDAVCELCSKTLDKLRPGWAEEVGLDDMLSSSKMLKYCNNNLSATDYQQLLTAEKEVKRKVDGLTAWRIEGTLREFPKFPPINVWFRFPVHTADKDGVLKDLNLDGVYQNKTFKKRPEKDPKDTPKERIKDRDKAFEAAYIACEKNGAADIGEIAEVLGKSKDTVRRSVQTMDKFLIQNGLVYSVENNK